MKRIETVKNQKTEFQGFFSESTDVPVSGPEGGGKTPEDPGPVEKCNRMMALLLFGL